MVTKSEFIDAQDVEIGGQTFTISRIPAFYAADIYDKIIANKGIIPQEEKLKMLSRCSVATEQGEVILDKEILVNTWVKSFQTLRELIDRIFDLNFGFSESGNPSRS